MSVGKTTIMIRHTQNIEDCEHCGKVFENGEDYWKDARNKCYCVDNACGWEDDETSDEALHIGSVVGQSEQLPCEHERTRAGHHPDQPSYCLDCGEEL